MVNTTPDADSFTLKDYTTGVPIDSAIGGSVNFYEEIATPVWITIDDVTGLVSFAPLPGDAGRFVAYSQAQDGTF